MTVTGDLTTCVFSVILNKGSVNDHEKLGARILRVPRCSYAEGGVLFEYI